MFEQYPAVKNSYLLGGLALLLALLSYHFAISPTLISWRLNRSLKTDLAKSAGNDYDPEYLIRKKANLNLILSRYQADTANFRGQAISSLAFAAAKNNVQIIEVPGTETTVRTGIFIMQALKFEGDYFSLIRFLRQVQQTPGIGVIRSVSLKSPPPGTQRQTKQTLTMQVYLTCTGIAKAEH